MVMTAEMVRDIYAQDAKPGAVLVTITATGLDEPLRLTDWPAGLTVGEDVYEPSTFTVDWGGAGDGEPARAARIEMAATGEAVELIRIATDAVVKVEQVRVSAPGQAERALRDTELGSAEVSAGTIKVALRGADYGDEYAVAARYTLARTPGAY